MGTQPGGMGGGVIGVGGDAGGEEASMPRAWGEGRGGDEIRGRRSMNA